MLIDFLPSFIFLLFTLFLNHQLQTTSPPILIFSALSSQRSIFLFSSTYLYIGVLSF